MGMRHLQEAEGNMNEQAKSTAMKSLGQPDEGARGWGGGAGGWVGCGCLKGKGKS